jgi:hypothetical protein
MLEPVDASGVWQHLRNEFPFLLRFQLSFRFTVSETFLYKLLVIIAVIIMKAGPGTDEIRHDFWDDFMTLKSDSVWGNT